MYYLFSESHMFIPTFVDLTSRDIDENRKKLMDANVQYPIGKRHFNLRLSKQFGEMQSWLWHRYHGLPPENLIRANKSKAYQAWNPLWVHLFDW